MKHIGLFEGIGGFSLAARWMGWETIAWCEINPFCQKVLKHHFPNAKPHEDIIQTDFNIYRGTCDIVTGGFPCQPYSQAGKRKGKEDDRHLWPEMLRAIKEIQPTWVVGENVLGLVNWSGGLVFHEVQTDLETAGYEVFPFVLPACAVNAPHRRDRVWFIAYSDLSRCEQSNEEMAGGSSEQFNSAYFQQNVTNSESRGLEGFRGHREIGDTGRNRGAVRIDAGISNKDAYNSNNKRSQQFAERQKPTEQGQPGRGASENGFDFWPSQPPVCFGNDGIPAGLDGITFSKWRNESLKGGGNAIVPQVAFQIFKSIEQYEKLIS